MNRAEKISIVERLNQSFQTTPHMILTAFSGLTVNQANDLRKRVRVAGGRYTVIKNRLAKRAAAGTPMESLTAQLSGPCALAEHDSDPVVLAKALSGFSKDHPQLKLVAGVIDAKEVIDTGGVKYLASLPGLPELQAQLLALIQTPGTMIVRLLGTPATQIVRVVGERGKTLEDAS